MEMDEEEKQKMFNSIISETLKNLKLMKADQQIILIPYLEPFINERYLNNYMLLTLKQHQLYVKNYQRNIEIPLWFKSITFCFFFFKRNS